jgi:integrase
LKTHDATVAAKEALRLARLDDQIWTELRNGASSIEAARARVSEAIDPALIRTVLKSHIHERHRLSDALKEYLRKHEGRGEKFIQDANRAFETVKSVIGNPVLKEIKRTDARRVLDALIAQGLKTASIRRYLNTISAIVNAGILELEISAKNPFAAMVIPKFLADARKVHAFSEDELRQIGAAALDQKTEPGLIAAMQINLGCRVSEIASLRTEDVHADAAIPFVNIVEHRDLGRRLKTSDSARALPLLGVSLAATQLALTTSGGGWLFGKITKKNSASAVNRWLRKVLPGLPGSHMARHSFETRLILAKVDQRQIDMLMGHKLKGQGATYFSGFALEDLLAALQKIAID